MRSRRTKRIKSRPLKGGRDFSGSLSGGSYKTLDNRKYHVSLKDQLDGLRFTLRQDGVPFERAKEILRQAGADTDYLVEAELWWLLGEET